MARAKNKKRTNQKIIDLLTRLDWISEQLVANRRFNCTDAAAQFGLCSKTIARYIQVLRQYHGWAIKYDPLDRSYYLD